MELFRQRAEAVNPNFTAGVSGQMLQQVALGGAMIALPLFLQMTLEYNAMGAGLSLAATFVFGGVLQRQALRDSHQQPMLEQFPEPDMATSPELVAKGRTLFLIDIAVPRNIEPDVHKLDNVYVYNVDDLEQSFLFHRIQRGSVVMVRGIRRLLDHEPLHGLDGVNCAQSVGRAIDACRAPAHSNTCARVLGAVGREASTGNNGRNTSPSARAGATGGRAACPAGKACGNGKGHSGGGKAGRSKK